MNAQYECCVELKTVLFLELLDIPEETVCPDLVDEEDLTHPAVAG